MIGERTLWLSDSNTIEVIDQRKLPFEFSTQLLQISDDVAWAIREMVVRGAPLIGATAAFGVYFALNESPKNSNPENYFKNQCQILLDSRPTAINLAWAVRQIIQVVDEIKDWTLKASKALEMAQRIVEDDVATCKSIGDHGLSIIENLSAQKKGTLNILTHCNAGRLGCIEWGTATAPLYLAQEKGIDIHVWVDETRPRNQGGLTAWELGQKNIPLTYIVDNTGGYLMQNQMVDMVIVGTDRVTRNGDVANKIGTYLKALAAYDNQIPFYVACPSSSIDWTIKDGLTQIPIETRSSEEVDTIQGLNAHQELTKVKITPPNVRSSNYGFDITPARLVKGLITERGICNPIETDMLRLFPEYKNTI